MKKTYLIVHRVSYQYVKNVVDYTLFQIKKNSSNSTEFHICNDVGEIDYVKGSMVFVIGEPFQCFERRHGVIYIFLNFSVVLVLGGFFSFSPSAYAHIFRKRKALENKVACFDHLFDYWPIQTKKLNIKFSKFNISVQSFPVGIEPYSQEELIPLSTRKYDVCFVGGITPRRRDLLRKLEDMGIKLSPTSGMPLEDAARQSRVVLNLHARKSNHLEIPRILGAFAVNSAVITEDCFGITQFLPSGTYLSYKYSDLAIEIKNLITNGSELEAVAKNGYDWLKNHHLKECDIFWKKIFDAYL